MKSKLEVNTRLAELQRELARREALMADSTVSSEGYTVWESLVRLTETRIAEIKWVLNA